MRKSKTLLAFNWLIDNCCCCIFRYIMSYAWSSFIQVLFRGEFFLFWRNAWKITFSFLTEITLQLVVLMWAILFIFVGIPLHLCFLSIPVVIFLIVFCVYAVHFNKGIEMANVREKLTLSRLLSLKVFLFMLRLIPNVALWLRPTRSHFCYWTIITQKKWITKSLMP